VRRDPRLTITKRFLSVGFGILLAGLFLTNPIRRLFVKNQVKVQTFFDGFFDPLEGIISFRKFLDPLEGLELMNRQGKISVRAVAPDGGRKLEVTADDQEIGTFLMEFNDAGRELEAFRENRPATISTKKGEESYILNITPQ
jgi:hypothetical protein